MYTADDYERLCVLTKDIAVEQHKLTQRAAEVYIRIFNEYIAPNDPHNSMWYDSWLYDACRQELGLYKDSRVADVEATLDSDGDVEIRSSVTTQGETDSLYCHFSGRFLFDEEALTKWIEKSNVEYAERKKKEADDEAAAEKAKDEAEFERLAKKLGKKIDKENENGQDIH